MSSREEYWLRINRVLDYAAAHLDERLSLERLAEVALFSPFHFHRIFHALMGETLNAFVRRLRLEKAATLLASNPDASVTEVALVCGFSAPSVLAREFRKHFGSAPTVWRREHGTPLRKIGPVFRKDGQAGAGPSAYPPAADTSLRAKGAPMEADVQTLPAMRIVYLRHFGPYGPELAQAWAGFMTWAGSRDLLGPDVETLGVCPDNPEVTPPEKCRYDMGVCVGEDYKPRPDENTQALPGGRYVVHHFRGTADQVGQAWHDLFSVWFPDSGWQPDDRPCFERCGPGSETDPETGVFSCDICVPVKPL